MQVLNRVFKALESRYSYVQENRLSWKQFFSSNWSMNRRIEIRLTAFKV